MRQGKARRRSGSRRRRGKLAPPAFPPAGGDERAQRARKRVSPIPICWRIASSMSATRATRASPKPPRPFRREAASTRSPTWIGALISRPLWRCLDRIGRRREMHSTVDPILGTRLSAFLFPSFRREVQKTSGFSSETDGREFFLCHRGLRAGLRASSQARSVLAMPQTTNRYDTPR